MDARIDPAAALGIDLGDAHVIRNAGASARDALRSIVISEQLLGTREIILVKHTGASVRHKYPSKRADDRMRHADVHQQRRTGNC